MLHVVYCAQFMVLKIKRVKRQFGTLQLPADLQSLIQICVIKCNFLDLYNPENFDIGAATRILDWTPYLEFNMKPGDPMKR